MMLREALVLQAAGRGLSIRWVVYIGLAWFALAVISNARLPFRFPFAEHDDMIDSAVVVGLVLPLSVMARMLDEGAPHLVAGASRRLVEARCAWAVAFLCVTSLGAVGAWLVSPVPFDLFMSDALFFGFAMVLGVGLLGSRLGWLVPTTITFLASAPGIVPWQANLLYREDMTSTLLLFVAIVGFAAMVAYVRNGGFGVFTTRAARRADATLSVD